MLMRSNSPTVTIVSKSSTNLSIVITTMEGIVATFLMENKEIWQSNIPFSKAIYDKEWFKLVVHTVPVRPFNMDNGLDILKSEIETFNLGIKCELAALRTEGLYVPQCGW